MNIEIANRLLTLRKQFNLSQEELAERLGISRQAVSRWERAEASPDTDNLINLSKLYGVSIDSLLMLDTDAADNTAFQTNSQVAPQYNRSPNETPEYGAGEAYRAGAVRDDDTEQLKKMLRRLSPAYPIIVTMVYLFLGFAFGLWHPAWMIFLTIPIFFIAVIRS